MPELNLTSLDASSKQELWNLVAREVMKLINERVDSKVEVLVNLAFDKALEAKIRDLVGTQILIKLSELFAAKAST